MRHKKYDCYTDNGTEIFILPPVMIVCTTFIQIELGREKNIYVCSNSHMCNTTNKSK